ncbi:MAG: hypothetical protein H6779_01120 [Candidatus Nomurabacteria bacterium]|nr:MAG: hypothetical protein H6779_01120 [Candidatus Nomurabacteria bacterium]
MKKVRLLTHRTDAEKVLEVAQAVGAVEFQAVADLGEVENSVEAYEVGQSTELSRITQALTFLNTYEPTVGTWTKLVEGTTIEIKESELKKQELVGAEIEGILEEVASLHNKVVENSEQLRTLRESRDILTRWQTLSVPLSKLTTAYTATYFTRKKDSNSKKNESTASFADQLEQALAEAGVTAYTEEINDDLVSVTVYKIDDFAELVSKTVQAVQGEFVQLPSATDTPAVEIKNLDQQISVLEANQAELENEAKKLAKEKLSVLRVAHDLSVWKKERQEATKAAKATKRVAIFEGWCNEYELPTLKNKLAEANALCEVIEIAPNEGEEPPVELKNNANIQPFEIITRLYGLPTHKDIDPTPFLAGFFFLFFGLSLTDVGYGVFLMAVSLLVLFYFKVSPTIKMFGKLLFLMGLASALVGLLFGGYLGIDAAKLPDSLKAIQMFDPIGNPLPVFYLALALGVVQVMFGMMLKIYSDARNNMLMTGILDQGPWLLLFTSLILYGAANLGYLATASSDDLLPLVYLSLVIVVVASGRTGKTILGKVQMSLLSLYNSIGYFSDILSYSRLLALGLATSALAFAVNLIAGIVSDMIPYVGFIFAIIILIVGHLFTLVVNTLGAFIHSARLQFVEFFGKFITGTGRTFKPLTRKESHISIVKDSG